MRAWFAFVSCVGLFAVPALAQSKTDFAAYEGPPQIVEGTGGTKITKHEIDYWTTGTPPRRYQVIGYIQDKRDEDWDGGHAVGSPKIAKQVKQAHGDAVIFLSQEESGQHGSMGTGMLGGLFLGGGSKTVSRMLVIRYLPAEAPPQMPKAPEQSPRN